MKEREIKKRCPICGSVLGTFIETGNDHGERIGLVRFYCPKSQKTYDEKDLKEIRSGKLEEKIRKEMVDLGIPDDKATNKARQIADEEILGKLIGGHDE